MRVDKFLVLYGLGLLLAAEGCNSDKVAGVPRVNADSIAKVQADSIKLASAMKAKYVAVVSTDGGIGNAVAITGKLSTVEQYRADPSYLDSPNSYRSAVITDLSYGEPFVVGAASSVNMFALSVSISAGYVLDNRVGGLTTESGVSFHNEGAFDFFEDYTLFYGDTAYIKYAPSGMFRDEFKLIAQQNNHWSRVSFAVGEVLSCRGGGSGYMTLMKNGVSMEVTFSDGVYNLPITAPKLYKIECYRLDEAPANVKAAIMAGRSLVDRS